MSDMELYRFFGLEQIAQGKIDQCRVVSCTALRNHHPGNKVDRRIRTGTKWLLRCIKGNWEYLLEKVTQEYGAQVHTYIRMCMSWSTSPFCTCVYCVIYVHVFIHTYVHMKY